MLYDIEMGEKCYMMVTVFTRAAYSVDQNMIRL